jgi:hypothetical protein
VVCKAIADFLGGNDSAVRFTDHARQDLTESSWPEVQCSIDGNLDSPASFKELTVKKAYETKFKTVLSAKKTFLCFDLLNDKKSKVWGREKDEDMDD